MQLSLQKHYIQFTLKYVLLKYVISVIGTLFKSKRSFTHGNLRSTLAPNVCILFRAVTIHQTHDSVRITIFDPRFGSYHDFFVGGGRKKKRDF